MSWAISSLLSLPPAFLIPKQSAIAACCKRSYATAISAAEVSFGQPVHETHPHLLAAGDITPGISALEYFERRQALSDLLPANSVAILAASDLKYRSGSSAAFYKFHQDPDFFYLTGFNEPEAVAVIEKKTSKTSEAKFHLFVRPKNEHEEQWEGSRSGVQAAMDVFNADEASDVSRLSNTLPSLLVGNPKIFTDLPRSFQHKTTFSRYLSGSPLRTSDGIAKIASDASVKPLRPLLNQLRVKKSPAEVALMRKVGQASGRALTEAMRKQWSGEKELHAFIDYQSKIDGMDGEAYVPVVAGGKNALSIHYVRNDSVLSDHDLVLVDAGGQYGGYIADITRTWPISGLFTPAQRDLYTAVLGAQRKCVSLCREDAETTLDRIHEVAEKELKSNLQQLGFDMSGNALTTLFPHHVGHYIGLDVHDSPGFPRSEILGKGHCITIEPGIYVPNSSRWPSHFRNMGIRIEDSVCIDSDSPLVLTTEAVKEVEDIEALRR